MLRLDMRCMAILADEICTNVAILLNFVSQTSQTAILESNVSELGHSHDLYEHVRFFRLGNRWYDSKRPRSRIYKSALDSLLAFLPHQLTRYLHIGLEIFTTNNNQLSTFTMKISATLLTFCLGMGMHMATTAAPINSTTTGITVGDSHSSNLTNTTTVHTEPVKRDGTSWEWWCDWWWEPICGGKPGPNALNVPIDPTTGEVLNSTALKMFADVSRVTPAKCDPHWRWIDPCCTTFFCHRKEECDIPLWDTGSYHQRCGWCSNPINAPPESI